MNWRFGFWLMLGGMLFFAGLFLWTNTMWGSELSKRVELEQKLSDCEDVGKMARIEWNGNDTIYADTTKDSLIRVVSSKWIMKAQKSSYVFPAETLLLDTTIIYDSSEVTE